MDHVGTAFDWARDRGLPPTRVIAAEFGCLQRWADCAACLVDVIDAVDPRGGQGAFDAFRETFWDGMDYELLQDLPPGRFYWLKEQGRANALPHDGPLIELLRARPQE